MSRAVVAWAMIFFSVSVFRLSGVPNLQFGNISDARKSGALAKL
ncbi:Uncharacterized protein dnm_024430 [Desulfonema magnum]|uniref:Uncharacterized protein n=1 Tax=Desulfonema magnum TaxID=45655 RepID=A0A975BIP0_9BACT|nr:Uncharacterized protein dnm_024430 [Desulfonema magnum]